MSDDPHTLSIGAVTRLTGIPSDTIRTWERRYRVVEPDRDGSGRRVYTRDHVDRLRVIAALSDQGERVADLAHLTYAELRERIALHTPTKSAPSTIRVAVVHPTLTPSQVAGISNDGHTTIEVAELCRSLPELALQSSPDLLVIDASILGSSPGSTLAALRAQHSGPVLVTHHFLSRTDRQQLVRPNVRLVQGPITSRDLRQQMTDLARSLTRPEVEPAEPTPEAQFSRAQLESILDSSPHLVCECPRHLAALVLSLRAFELYSYGCASNSVQDQVLHNDLARETGEARAVMETLLRRVCAHDGLEI